MSRVIVVGSKGKMGKMAVENLRDLDDIAIVAGVDPKNPAESLSVKIDKGSEEYDLNVIAQYQTLEDAFAHTEADILLEFSGDPQAALANATLALAKGLDVIVGTTGVPGSAWKKMLGESETYGNVLLVVPNFSVGAVLMMYFSGIAARFMGPAEIIELHHDQKRDAPSGTAKVTANTIANAPGYAGAEQILVGDARTDTMRMADPARGELGAGNIPIHSVRLPSLIAHQEVLLSGPAQLLTLRHDSFDRVSFAPGIILALRWAGDHVTYTDERTKFIIGLEGVMGL
jgi:4-hydroxy-tetrahydrodipicolinate reductase